MLTPFRLKVLQFVSSKIITNLFIKFNKRAKLYVF